MHDLKGTLTSIPDFKLGPELNWLMRIGVEPVDFSILMENRSYTYTFGISTQMESGQNT